MWCLMRRLGVRGVVREYRRTYLTEAFGCREAWEERFQSPVLKKVKLEELLRRVEQSPAVNPLDVDFIANVATPACDVIEDVEEALHRLRMGDRAADILPSTSHAVIRLFLDQGEHSHLLRMLDDRLNYGLFPDDYCSLLLLDEFLKDGKFRDAAKVAALHMLQEDFDNPLITYMSLLASYKYAINPTPWTDTIEDDESKKNKDDDDDEEEIRVRVKFLRNPYFDDHFDLREWPAIIGKTLMSAGQVLEDQLGDSFYLVGSALYEKWEPALQRLEALLKANKQLYREAFDFFKESLNKQAVKEGQDADAWNRVKTELEECLKKFDSASLTCDGNLADLTELRIKNLVEKEEKRMITEQKKVYNDWIDNRENLLMKMIEETKREERLAKVKQAKEELAKREEELFFFDKEDELDMKIDNKKVVYPRKWTGRKKKKRTETADYVPPVVN